MTILSMLADATSAAGLLIPEDRGAGLQEGTSRAVLAQEVDAAEMSTITTKGGTQIFYKVWRPKSAQPIVFHRGWPSCADDWDNWMLFFQDQSCRVIAHDRRGHGRSSQTDTGNDMDTYTTDMAELAAVLDLADAVHVGHFTGGGEVARCVARHGKGRVAKAILVGAVPPVMVKSEKNPGGTPMDVFDRLRVQVAAALLSIKLVKNGTLKVYPGLPHGMCSIHPDIINPDLLAFIEG